MRHTAREMVSRYGVQLSVLVAAWVVLVATTPSLRGAPGIYSILLSYPLLGLIGLGLTCTMLTGELDLSVAAASSVAGAIAVRTSNLGLVWAIVIPVLVVAAFGALQGLIIARLGINSMLITLGTMLLLGGICFDICGGQPINVSNIATTMALFDRWSVLSPDIIVAIVVFVAVGLFLAYSRYGRELYATGGARREAIAAGVPVRRSVVIAFTLAAGLAALAGAISALKVGSAQPTANTTLLLEGVTAALIGGISLYGGRGTVVNVILGTGILGIVAAGMSALGEQDYTVQLITGSLLFIVIVLEVIAARLRVNWVSRLPGRRRSPPGPATIEVSAPV
jgi:ribose transport system permease protein